MTAFNGFLSADPNLLNPPIPGTSRAAYTWRPQFSGFGARVDNPSALAPPGVYGTFSHTGGKSTFGSTAYLGYQADLATPAFDFFEKFHVIPRSFSFGNVLSTQLAAIEVYNAFRRVSHYWTAYLDNTGGGVTLIGQPSLPALVPYQHGIQMTLQVATTGPPRVDTTLDFTFDTGVTIHVPITLQRVVLFSMPPESGYREQLEFLTDVIVRSKQTEQRIRLRKCPRQFFEWEVFLADGQERDAVEAILFDWQSQVFGVPILHEMQHTTVVLAANATTVTVPTTANADYRDGGLFLLYTSQFVFDVLQLSSHTGTTLVSTTGTLNAYPIGTQVMPLRTALAPSSISGSRWRINAGKLRIRFQVNDNDVSIASAAGLPTFNGKVLLSDPNPVGDQLTESYEREVEVLDSMVGLVSQQAPADRHRRISKKTFWSNTPAGLWANRQLMHFLGGRNVSFYIPTFYTDLELSLPLVSGANTMVVKYVGYAQFIRNRQPKNVIRLTLTDGSTIIRTITASSLTTSTTETLTLDANWAANVPVANVSRIEYLEKTRFDSDTIDIEHTPGECTARISARTRTVLE